MYDSFLFFWCTYVGAPLVQSCDEHKTGQKSANAVTTEERKHARL